MLRPVDQWAVDHLMPGLDPAGTYHVTVVGVLQPYRAGVGALEQAADVWLYPGSVPVSALGVGLCALVLLRRGRRQAALLWASAWVMGVLIELAGKELLRKPALFGGTGADRVHVEAFDASFPSGHTIRGLVLAAAVAFVWRRARWAAAAWAVSLVVLLVATGAHVLSDVAGGLLVALLLVQPLYARLRPEPA